MDDDNDDNDNDDTHPPRIIVRFGMVFRRGQKLEDTRFTDESELIPSYVAIINAVLGI